VLPRRVSSPLFPYSTLFRSELDDVHALTDTRLKRLAPAPRLDDRLVVSVAGDVHTKNQGPIVRHRRPPTLRCEHESQGDDRVVRLGREVALDPDLECRGFLAPLPAVRLDGLTRCKTRDYPLPRACIGRVLGVDVEQLPALRVRKRIEERAAGLG